MLGRRLTLALASGLVATAPAAAQTGVVPDSGTRVVKGPSGDECRQVRLAAQAGFPWVTVGTDWEGLEPTRGQYVAPAEARQLLQCAKDLGLNTHLVVSNAPAWASGRSGVINDPPTAANVPAYGSFLGQLAGQLAPVVDVWTIWNEPSFELFWASPRDPARYVAMQKAAYAAIKPVDPMSRVSAAAVVGTPTGSGTNAWEYLEAMFANGIKGSADLYLWNFYPRTTPEGTAQDYRGRPAPWALSSGTYARELLDKHDPGKPLWITETSYATCKSPCSGAANQVTEAVQADYLTRMYTYRRRYLSSSVERLFWFQLRDQNSNVNDWFGNLGLYRFDWTAKPSLGAFSAMRVAGTTPSSPPPGGGTAPAVPTPTLPPSGSAAPAPPRGTAKNGVRAKLSPVRVTARKGRLTITVRATLSRGKGRLRVEGFRAKRWRLVKVVRLPRTATVTLRVADRGYLGVRVMLRPDGTSRWTAARVARIPKGR